MKVTKRRKISSELHVLGLKGGFLATVSQHLDYQHAIALKQQLSGTLNPTDQALIEYWIEPEPTN